MIVKRWRLILLVTLGQTLGLLVGMFWLCGWADRAFTQLAQRLMATHQQQLVRELATLIQDVHEQGGQQQAELLAQRLVHQVHLPGDGYLALVHADSGHVLAENASKRPAAETKRPSSPSSRTASGPTRAEIHPASPPRTLASAEVPALRARLLVRQPWQANPADRHPIIPFIRSAALVIGLVLIGCCTLWNAVLLRHYDQQMSRLNTTLGQAIQERADTLVRTRDAIIFGLARLADSRDNETSEHLDRITGYVHLLAQAMAKSHPEMTREFIDQISFASPLHDIGKVGIPDAILLKPGKLSPEERAIMQQHTIIGGQCLSAIIHRLGHNDSLEMARDIALAHHERWDGKGYPFGLQGDQIPLPARIVALADYYDALTSKRVYKLAMSHDEARKIILDESGLQFDPEVVQAFLESEEGFRQISRDLAQRRDGSSAYLPPLLPPFDARSAPRSDWSADLARQAVAFAHRLAADVAGQVEQEVHRAEKVEAEINRLIALWDGDDQLPSVATRVLENNNLLRRQLAATAARLDCEAHDLEDRLVEAQRDTVTGLIQRRQFEQELSNRSSQWNSRATCYGLLLIAIDKLQQVEAYTGSEKMDEILLAGARFLGTLTRETDLVACYQRGVYAVALPGVSLDNAAKVAERIRAALEAARLATEEEELALTVSIGLTETAPGASVATIIRQAEAALQEAQRLGGNACVCWQGEVAVGGGGGW